MKDKYLKKREKKRRFTAYFELFNFITINFDYLKIHLGRQKREFHLKNILNIINIHPKVSKSSKLFISKFQINYSSVVNNKE